MVFANLKRTMRCINGYCHENSIPKPMQGAAVEASDGVVVSAITDSFPNPTILKGQKDWLTGVGTESNQTE